MCKKDTRVPWTIRQATPADFDPEERARRREILIKRQIRDEEKAKKKRGTQKKPSARRNMPRKNSVPRKNRKDNALPTKKATKRRSKEFIDFMFIVGFVL